jgi:hypothetical protein
MGRRSTVKRHDILETANIRLLRACGQRASESGESIAQASAAYEALRRYPPLNSRVREEIASSLRALDTATMAARALERYEFTLKTEVPYTIGPLTVPLPAEKQEPKVHGVNAQHESRTRPKVGGAGKGKRS